MRKFFLMKGFWSLWARLGSEEEADEARGDVREAEGSFSSLL